MGDTGFADPGGAPRVLVVDPDDRTRKAMARILERQGYLVREAGQGRVAVAVCEAEPVDVAVIDLGGDADADGVTTLRGILARSADTLCVVVTSSADAAGTFEALNSGAYDYFEKPIQDWTRFGLVLRKAVELRQIRAVHERLERRLSVHQRGTATDEIIGKSAVVDLMRERIGRFARTRVPLLITGESGSGKELVARALHRASPWAERPFVDINCAAIPRELLESELFGYEPGAFTEAKRRKPGLFEVAEDGTLFLDEVGELPLDLQAKLLRVLETGEFRRVGATRNIRSQARVVSATNRDLRKMVEEGTFRKDLLYRLEVGDIRVPPLRERLEDIPLLAWCFVARFNSSYGLSVRRIDPEAMRCLTSCDWRENNVRELQHVIHRAMVLADSDTLTADLLDRSHRKGDGPVPPLPAEGDAMVLPDALTRLTYKEFKAEVVNHFSRAYLTAVLKRTGWNISEASREAGQERPNFKKLMRRFGVVSPLRRADPYDGEE